MFHRISEGEKRRFGINWIASLLRWAVVVVIPLFPSYRTRYEFDVDEVMKGWCFYCFYFRISRSIHKKFYFMADFNWFPVGKQNIERVD